MFPGTGATIPYALFVPSHYDRTRAWPLMVGLHGAGRPYDWLMGYEGIIDLAQRDGIILVTPLGYHPRGGYGSAGPGIDTRIDASERAKGTLPANLGELSEQDVMNVLQLVRAEFNVDPDRIFLWGHSLGGAGTYHLASRHPDIWAGLAVAAPGVRPWMDRLQSFRHIPILVLQGVDDRTVPVGETRKWVAEMKRLGMQHVYVEVHGGDHSLFISKNRETMAKVFGFFSTLRKSQRPAPQ